jgi:hypothetical protein
LIINIILRSIIIIIIIIIFNHNNHFINMDDIAAPSTPTLDSFQGLQERIARMNLNKDVDEGKENLYPRHLETPTHNISNNIIKMITDDILCDSSLYFSSFQTPIKSSSTLQVTPPPVLPQRGMLDGMEEEDESTSTTSSNNRKRVRCSTMEPPALPGSPEFIDIGDKDNTITSNTNMFERHVPMYSPISRVSTTTTWNMNYMARRGNQQPMGGAGHIEQQEQEQQSQSTSTIREKCITIANAFPLLLPGDEEDFEITRGRPSMQQQQPQQQPHGVRALKMRKRHHNHYHQEQEELRILQQQHFERRM